MIDFQEIILNKFEIRDPLQILSPTAVTAITTGPNAGAFALPTVRQVRWLSFVWIKASAAGIDGVSTGAVATGSRPLFDGRQPGRYRSRY